jgi:kynurenine formamidase
MQFVLACAFCVLFATQTMAQPTPLERAYEIVHASRFVDLTHAFAPGIPHWKGFGDERVKTLFTYDTSGFLVQEFSHVGQWGTHVDPPAHFIKGLRTVDQIRPDEMFLRLVVIDVHDKVAKNPDYVLTLDDIKAWERQHGAIPAGAFVAMRTDWSNRWPDEASMQNVDAHGVAHYPGWSQAVLTYLYEVRKITASGHETTDTDPGLAVSRDDYELLANLDQVPEAGALVLVSFPKPLAGSGFPARVIAIVP